MSSKLPRTAITAAAACAICRAGMLICSFAVAQIVTPLVTIRAVASMKSTKPFIAERTEVIESE